MEPESSLRESPRFQRMSEVERLIKQENVIEALAQGASSAEAAFAASTNPTWIALTREADAEFDAACEMAAEDGAVERTILYYPEELS